MYEVFLYLVRTLASVNLVETYFGKVLGSRLSSDLITIRET